MNTKTTLLALAVAIVLAAYYLVFDTDLFNRKLPSTREREEQKAKAVHQPGQPLFEAEKIEIDKVRTIRLQTPGSPAVVFQRDAGKPDEWTQIEPVAFPLQGYLVNDILHDASALRFTSTIKSGPDAKLGDMGLQPPRMVLTFGGEAMKERTLALGLTTGAGRAYLALEQPTDTSTIYVVNDRLQKTLLGKKVHEFRSTSLTNIEPGSVRRAVLTQGEQSIELGQADGRWSILQPIAGRADRQAASDLVRSVSTALIDQFIRDQPEGMAIYGLDKPSTVLSIDVVQAAEPPAAQDTAKKDEAKKDDAKEPPKPAEKLVTHKLAIGSAVDLRKERYYAQWNDAQVVFTLRKADVEKLHKTVDALRDPRLTPVSRSDIRDVRIEPASGPVIHLALDKGAWAFADPKPGFELDAEAMDELLNVIAETKASAFLPADQVASKKSLAKITLGLAGKADSEVFVVHDHEDGQVVVLRSNEATGYVVDRAPVASLLQPPLAFRNRKVLDITENSIASIKLERTGVHPLSLNLTRNAPEQAGPPVPGADKKDAKADAKPGDWKLDGLNAPAVRQLLASIAPLRAKSWLESPPVTTPEGVSLEVTLGDNTRHKIFIHPESRAARVDGLASSFVVDDAVIQAVAAELRDPTLLTLERDQILSISNGTWTLGRSPNGDFILNGKAPKAGQVNEGMASALFEAAAGLRAAHFVEAKLDKPDATFTIRLRDGKQHELRVWKHVKDLRAPAAALGDKTFTLDVATLDKLMAPIVTDKPVAPAPAP